MDCAGCASKIENSVRRLPGVSDVGVSVSAGTMTVQHVVTLPDGVVVSGESAVDEAPVTGESTPKRKKPEDAVFAGTINTDAALRVKVTAAAADNTIARVVRLVEEAQESKA